MRTTKEIDSIVRTLNDHHRRTCAGFYGSLIGGRWFRAKREGESLFVFDFDEWVKVDDDKIRFHDHNGRNIV